jgi:outer membrane protein assembly factor BamD
MGSKKSNIYLLFLLCLLFLNNFSTKKDDFKQYNESTLYEKAMLNLKHNQLKSSIDGFQKVNEMYPFSYWGKRAQMISAFTSYLNKDYKSAAIFSTSYITHYPDGEDIKYMHYLRAESYFMQIKNIDSNLSSAEEAKECFEYIINNFPNSQYVDTAKARLKIIHNLIAAKYLNIGIFYEKNMQYHSAINRFNEVVKNYSNTKYYDEAIFRLVETYKALKLEKEAQKYHQILRQSNSKWLKYIN